MLCVNQVFASRGNDITLMFICLIVSKKKMNQVLNLTFNLQDFMLIPRSKTLKKIIKKTLGKKHPVATAYTNNNNIYLKSNIQCI